MVAVATSRPLGGEILTSPDSDPIKGTAGEPCPFDLTAGYVCLCFGPSLGGVRTVWTQPPLAGITKPSSVSANVL
jgi:hypothetical protein